MAITNFSLDSDKLLLGFVCLAIGISFYNAGLPVPPYEIYAQLYPEFVKPLRFGRLSVHELFVAAAVGIAVVTNRKFRPDMAVGIAALALLALSVLSILAISTLGTRPLIDFMRAVRLIEHAVLIWLIFVCAQKNAVSLLNAGLLGLALSALVNLAISIHIPLSADTFMLHGQNTPIVNFALGLHFAYLKRLINKEYSIADLGVIGLFSAMVIFGASRTAYVVAAGAGLTFAYLFFHSLKFRAKIPRHRAFRYVVLGVLSVLFVAVSIRLGLFITAVESIQYKFFALARAGNVGDSYRLQMVYDTLNIVEAYPFGVGFSGYSEAKQILYGAANVAYVDVEDNPHSSFLYYFSSSGWLGLLVVLFLFSFAMYLWYVCLAASKVRLAVVGVVISYVAIGVSVPYLLNSLVLLAPLFIFYGHVRGSNEQRSATDLRV